MTSGATMALLKKKQQSGELKPSATAEAIENELDEAPAAPDPVDEAIAADVAAEEPKAKKAAKSKAKKTPSPEGKDTANPVDEGNIKTYSQEGDVLSDTVNIIENLDDETKALKMAHEMYDRGEFYYFALGGVLAKIQAEGWFGTYDNLKDLIEKEFGFKYRKGVYFINIYNCLNTLKLSPDVYAGIGWKKLGMIASLMTQENYKEWLQRAKDSTVSVLQDYITALNANNGDTAKAEAAATSLTTKTFKLHEDQKEVVEAALDLAKEKGGTEFDAVALEYVCNEFMAGGTVVPKKTKAAKAEAFDPAKADVAALRAQLLEAVQEQFENPDEQLQAYMGEDVSAYFGEYFSFDVNEK